MKKRPLKEELSDKVKVAESIAAREKGVDIEKHAYYSGVADGLRLAIKRLA